jgi:hypothetical protein
MRQVMLRRMLPAPETVADAIDRERAERQNAQRLAQRLRHGGLTRQK